MSGHLRAVRFDVENMVVLHKSLLLLAMLLPIVMSIHSLQQAELAQQSGYLLSTIDLWGSFFGGSRPHRIQNEEAFALPMAWMIVQLSLLFIVGFYTSRELRTTADQSLSRIGNTVTWWLSKCSSAVLLVLAFYTWCLVVFAILSLTLNSGFIDFHPELAFPEESELVPLLMFASPSELAAAVLAPLVCSFSLCLMHISLSLVLRPELSLAVVLAYIAVSIYAPTMLLVGDSGMLLRVSILVDGCYTSLQSIVSSFIWMTIWIAFGAINVFRRDFIVPAG